MTMRVYVAGPMRGYPDYNFPAFHAAAKYLRDMGFEVLNPAEFDLNAGFDPAEDPFTTEDLRRVIARDVTAILECDAIFMLPGWSGSKGATAERAVAEWLGISVYDSFDLLEVPCTS